MNCQFIVYVFCDHVPLVRGEAAVRCSRGIFDKEARRKPLAFAADAGHWSESESISYRTSVNYGALL